MRNLSPIGHNNPPSEAEILQERLDGYIDEAELYQSLADREIPETIEDEAAAGKVTDYIKAVSDLTKKISDIHRNEKKPFLDAGKVADAWKREYEAKLNELKKNASAPLNDFLERKAAAERKREMELAIKKREEAERLAVEARAHADEGINDTAEELMNAAIQSEQTADMIANHAIYAKPSQLTKARGSMGSSASQRLVWVGEIESVAAIDLEALRPYFAQDAIQKALNAAIRNGVRDIRGAKIEQKAQISVR